MTDFCWHLFWTKTVGCKAEFFRPPGCDVYVSPPCFTCVWHGMSNYWFLWITCATNACRLRSSFKFHLSSPIPQFKGWGIKARQPLTFPTPCIYYPTRLITLFLCLRQMWGGRGMWCGEMSRSCRVHILSEIGICCYRSFGSTENLFLYEIGWSFPFLWKTKCNYGNIQ